MTTFENLNGVYSEDHITYTRRSSTDGLNQKNSTEYQKQIIQEYAKSNNLSIAPLTIPGFCEQGVIEEDHSAFKVPDSFELTEDGSIKQKISRPKFFKLIKFLKNGEFKGVIIHCWDRISRNELDDVLIKKMIKLGVDVRFTQTEYDESSAGELHMDIDGVFSRHYSRVTGEKVRKANDKLRKEGRVLFSAPIGYLNQGSNNKPFDPERANKVKRLFELYATGEWSYVTLAAWANKNGLTTVPKRRNRTKEEILMRVDVKTIPKISRAITSKHIECILKNPFYMGINKFNKLNTQNNAFEPLIDAGLFFKVQKVIRERTVVLHYDTKDYYPYRGVVHCSDCGRVYSPYLKKGITYYTSRCRKDCPNKKKTVNQAYLNSSIHKILTKISFTKNEIIEIEKRAQKDLRHISNKRDNAMKDLGRRLKKTTEDLDFLAKESLTLMRKGLMSGEKIKTEENRLNAEIADIQKHIHANTNSTRAMLDYVIRFSDLVGSLSQRFLEMLDTEKQELVLAIFSELTLKNGILNYVAKPGYQALLNRHEVQNRNSGGRQFLVSELINNYLKIKRCNEQIQFMKYSF